jgi:8-oxo-dGTP pyrophosphatase MutT (NUDIX family)
MVRKLRRQNGRRGEPNRFLPRPPTRAGTVMGSDPAQTSGWVRARTLGFLFVAGLWRRMTLGTRGMLVDGDKVLLIRHGYVPGWQFPGGGIEPGETAVESVRREVEEETGYAITGTCELFGFYHNADVSKRDHVAFYVCRAFEQVREFQPNREIEAIGWFDRGDLPDQVTVGTRRRIAELFEGSEKAAVW